MNLVWSTLLVLVVSATAAGVLLLVRRRAPAGSVFEDGDRAAGVFGVLATGFSVLLGLIVFLAYSSYDASRAGAEDEARLIAQQYETAQFLPPAARAELGIAVIGGTEERLHGWTAPEFEVRSGQPVPAGIDGETVLLDPPLRFRIRPGVLRVLIAPSHPGASPSAAEPDGAWDVLRTLGAIALGRA